MCNKMLYVSHVMVFHRNIPLCESPQNSTILGKENLPEEIICQCGGLNENGPHRCIGSEVTEVWPCWRKCFTRVGFEVSKAQARPRGSLPAARGSGCRTLVWFSSTMSACMHTVMLPALDDGLSSEL